MTDIDIKKLAELSRLSVDADEMVQLEHELPAILAFVEQVQSAHETGSEKNVGVHYNIMRNDENPHESGEYTQVLLDAMPQTHEGYLKVRKIIQQD